MKNSTVQITEGNIAQFQILGENLTVISTPLIASTRIESTKRTIDGLDGLHELLISIPVLWLESICDRINQAEVGKSVYVSKAECSVLIEIIEFMDRKQLIQTKHDCVELLQSIACTGEEIYLC